MHFVARHRVDVLGDQPIFERQPDPKIERNVAPASQPDGAADLPPLHVWRPAQAIDPDVGDTLEPHRLPDTGRPWIPDRMRLRHPVLFAARLFEVERIVLGADDNLALIVAIDRGGDVAGKRHVAALVRPDHRAIRPDRGAIIDGAKVQQDARTIRRYRRYGDAAAVPARLEEPVIADA